jgi:hypothetical protein
MNINNSDNLTICFKIRKIYILPTQCVYVCHVILTRICSEFSNRIN